MTNVYKFGRDQDRSVEASTWISKIDKGLSAAETEALKKWMRADPRNESSLLAMAEVWDKMDALARLAEIFPHPAAVGGSTTMRHYRRIALAAVLVLAVAGLTAVVTTSVLVDPQFEGEEVVEASSYETAIGGLSRIELTDGSQITLNSQSSVEVRFSDRQRQIKLDRGEIHVDVAHDPARPLLVIVGGRIVQAVGTAFSVKIDETQRVEVLVVDGEVLVGIHPASLADAGDWSAQTTLDLHSDSLLVSQGERALFDATSEKLEVLEPEELEIELSWRDGNLVFRGESLAEAVRKVGRYTRMEFVIADEDLGKKRVAGLFKTGDVTGFLSSLEANFDVTYERLDDQTILLSAHTAEQDSTQQNAPE